MPSETIHAQILFGRLTSEDPRSQQRTLEDAGLHVDAVRD